MLCERCRKAEAAIHLTEIMQEMRSEVHLCEACAKEIGLNSKLSSFSLSLPDMLSFIEMDDAGTSDDLPVCLVCGTDFVKYAKHGKLGCPACYRYLEGPISGVIRGYHGDKKHSGKIPSNMPAEEEAAVIEAASEISDMMNVDELKKNLRSALRDERYEDAAILRDKINLAEKAELKIVD
jgi:protein arginine kinase activator